MNLFGKNHPRRLGSLAGSMIRMILAFSFITASQGALSDSLSNCAAFLKDNSYNLKISNSLNEEESAYLTAAEAGFIHSELFQKLVESSLLDRQSAPIYEETNVFYNISILTEQELKDLANNIYDRLHKVFYSPEVTPVANGANYNRQDFIITFKEFKKSELVSIIETALLQTARQKRFLNYYSDVLKIIYSYEPYSKASETRKRADNYIMGGFSASVIAFAAEAYGLLDYLNVPSLEMVPGSWATAIAVVCISRGICIKAFAEAPGVEEIVKGIEPMYRHDLIEEIHALRESYLKDL